MYDDGVFGDDISREDIKPENSDKIKKLISKSQKNIQKQIEDAGFSEFRGNFFDKRDKKVKEVPKVSTAKVSKQAVKSVSDLANQNYAAIANSAGFFAHCGGALSNYQTTSFKVFVLNISGNNTDRDFNSAVVLGD